jgi:hypothetical protein
MFNEMPTLQPANQHRQSSWSFDIKEKGSIVSTERKEGGKAKARIYPVYQSKCKGCSKQFECNTKSQPYCSHDCYVKHKSKLQPMIPCMVCLQGLGFGIKAIGRNMAMKHPVVRITMIRAGVYNPKGTSKVAGNREFLSSRQNAVDPGNNLKIRRAPKRTYESDHKTPIQKTRRLLRNQISRMCFHMRMQRDMRTEQYVGCSFEEAKRRIESQFTRGMTWENYGSFWTLDHIVPLSSFDLSDERQRMFVNHISNLRPLNAKENIQKGNKIPAAHQFDLIAN